MPKKALVDYSFIKELSENILKKDRKSFKAKVKSSLNGGSKREKNLEKIRHLLLAAAKGDPKSGKKKSSRKSGKKPKLEKRTKTFTQFDSGSGSASSSSHSSTESESDSASENPKPNSEASGGSSGSESENAEAKN